MVACEDKASFLWDVLLVDRIQRDVEVAKCYVGCFYSLVITHVGENLV